MGLFDFLTLAIFAGLIVLFLQRSVDPDGPRDHLWQYMVPSIGCAIANYAGNEGQTLVAATLIVGIIAYVLYVLRPFPNFPRT